jgi:hypothetical protein
MRTLSIRPAPRRPGASILLPAAVLLLAGACGRGAPPPPEKQAERLPPALRPVAQLRLEESAEVINVAPRVSLEAGGGFLVSDEREAQVRVYDSAGRLLRHFGGKGRGPGEFDVVLGALRLPSREILAIDMFGRATVFDSTGATVVRSGETSLGSLYHARVMNDSLVLLAGRPREGDASRRLHLWNRRTGRIAHSFFAPPLRDRTDSIAAATMGFVSVAARGDTLAAVFALRDTVYLFDRAGRSAGKVPIRFQRFRPITPAPRRLEREDGRRWATSFSLITDLFWLPDGDFVVQFQDRTLVDRNWHLHRMSRGGRRVAEVHDTPHLLAVDAATSLLWFVRPGADAPNEWTAARWVP